MNLRDTPEEKEFRSAARSWLSEHAPESNGLGVSGAALRTLDDISMARAWSSELAAAGYAGLTWPAEYGGQDAPLAHQAIFYEESARAFAPQHLGVIGVGIAGPTLIAHGSSEQKARHLQKILTADEIWCQGFSEPEAGSDLAAVRTLAKLQDGCFRVNGQKIWSSFANLADWCLLLAKTDPSADRHSGLTMMLVDVRSVGLEVRPIKELTGEAVFNEIFFTDVEVPLENVIGEVGHGWQVAMTSLLHERATLGTSLAASLEAMLARVIALALDLDVDNEYLLDRLGREWIEIQGLKLTNQRSLTQLSKTGIPGPEGSLIKLRWSESNQRLMSLALEMFGERAPVADEDWQYQLLRSRGNTIEAGTSEVLRSIIAERVLDLPRSR